MLITVKMAIFNPFRTDRWGNFSRVLFPFRFIIDCTVFKVGRATYRCFDCFGLYRYGYLFVVCNGKALLIPIFKRTSGAIAFSVLAILYFSRALHPFLPRIQSLSKTSVFHTIRLQIFNSLKGISKST